MAEQKKRPADIPKLEQYKPTRFMLPTSHYDKKKADKAVKFIEMLRHTKGKWAGERFWLFPWQEQVIRDIFGIVDEDGHRQFRTAYVEIPKKNGKSELAAAVALYLLYADNEPSAEVYGAAADRQQASIVFDVARQMVDMMPSLLKRSKIMTAGKRIVNYRTSGFYQVLSAEVGTKHGLNVSGLVFDELHNVIHYGFIEKFIEDLGKQYHICEIAFDRWGATQMVQDLEGMPPLMITAIRYILRTRQPSSPTLSGSLSRI